MGGCKVDEITKMLPNELAGWRKAATDQQFGPDNLYTYINGGAELYRSYGFHNMLNRTYSRPGQPDIIVDIFDMGSATNAFGVFTHSRESIAADFGQGSQYDPGYLIFWRDRYLVSILASPETPESRQALESLAQGIVAGIGHAGKLPEILTLLPTAALVEESIRYFYNFAWQNSHYFIAEDNILNINDSTQALLAKYGPPQHRMLLLLVNYPSVAAATAARASFTDNFLPEAQTGEAAQLEDGSWVAIRTTGPLLAVVFKAPSEAAAGGLLNQISPPIPVEHNVPIKE